MLAAKAVNDPFFVLKKVSGGKMCGQYHGVGRVRTIIVVASLCLMRSATQSRALAKLTRSHKGPIPTLHFCEYLGVRRGADHYVRISPGFATENSHEHSA